METDWKPVLRQVSTLRALLNQIMGRNTRESVRFGGFARGLWADTPRLWWRRPRKRGEVSGNWKP